MNEAEERMKLNNFLTNTFLTNIFINKNILNDKWEYKNQNSK